MSVKRLLIFSPLYPPHVGGLESHAEQFNEHLARQEHEITVFTPHVIEASSWQENMPGIEILRFPCFEIIPNYPVPKFWHPIFMKQWLIIWGKSYQIVISRTRFFLTSLMAMFYSKLKRTKWIHIEHGSDFVHLNNNFFSLLARMYDYTFGKMVFLSADKIVANSKASAVFVNLLVPKRKVITIYRGVDNETIKKIPPADIYSRYKIPDSKFVITYCGRLIDGKGVADLIKALSKINNEPFTCLIIGDGPQKANLKDLVRALKIDKNIKFLGELPWSQTIGIVKAADIAVNPSFTEGLPTSVIEAVLCHTAVIATDVGGTNEIVQDGISALLCRPQDIETMAQHLSLLLGDEEMRKQLAQRAYQNVIDRFSWSKSICQYEEIFDTLNI